MARIQLEQLTKVFAGGVRAVDGVNLSVAEGEFVVLVGPSGCGKSTTLRMIAGLEAPTAGTIRVGDRVVNALPPQARDVAVVFQNYALYPHMTVFANMAFALKLRRLPKGEVVRRVTGAARLLEIEYLLDRKPRELSGGQRQRVALGRAIVRDPAAFLFDEPLSNLDARLRVSTRAELKRLHRRLRTTTLYVTHDQEEAMTLGDRVVVMLDGVVQQADPPMETYLHPVNRFVAGFIGTPPMNFFDGVLRRDEGRLTFHEGRPPALAEAVRAGPAPAGRAEIAALSGFDLTSRPEGFRLTLPPHLSEVLGAYVDRPVVLGVRPEHLGVGRAAPAAGPSPEGEGAAGVIRAKVNVVEPLGRDMDLYLNTNLHEHVVARVDARRHADVRPDAWVDLAVDLSGVHVFEPGETGMNLSKLGGRAAAAPVATTTEPAHAIA